MEKEHTHIMQHTDVMTIPYGTTKLELFSAMAMEGFISARTVSVSHGIPLNEVSAEYYAKQSVMMAKALINELNKQQNETT